jgi:hypothetical protein
MQIIVLHHHHTNMLYHADHTHSTTYSSPSLSPSFTPSSSASLTPSSSALFFTHTSSSASLTPSSSTLVAKDFGLPVGPITLADEVGVDVANHVGVFLREHLGTRMLGSDPAAMQEMVDKGFLGRYTELE